MAKDKLNDTIRDLNNNSVTDVNLHNSEIGDAGAAALAEALKTNTSVTRVGLQSNQIGVAGVAALAEALKTNTSVTSVELQGNQISAAGAAALAEALKTNTSVTHVNLWLNQIGDAGAVAIAEALKTNGSVTSVNLMDNQIGVAGAMAIAEALKTNTFVESVDLYHNKIGVAGAAALAEALKVNRSVTRVELGSNQIGDAGAVAIAEVLKTNMSVTSVGLEGNYIGAAGAAALAEALKVNRSVTSMNLQNNHISDAGAVALAEALKTNTSVTSVELQGNQIGDAGAAALAEALKTNTSVKSVQLYSNGISDAGAAALAEALKTNTSVMHVNLYNNQIGDAGAAALAEALKVNRSVTRVELGSNQIGDAGAAALAEALKTNTSVEHVNLYGNGISDAGAAALAEALKTNTSITSIYLANNKIGGVLLKTEYVTRDHDTKVRALQMKEEAALRANNEVVQKAKEEQAVRIAQGNVEKVLDNIMTKLNDTIRDLNNNSVTSVNLCSGEISDAGAVAIAEALKTNTSVTHVNLSYNGIGDAGAAALAEVLKTNTSITSMSISHNQIGDVGATVLAQALKVNRFLTDVNLLSNKIGDAGAVVIAEALKTNTSVKSMYLGENQIGVAGAVAIAGALKVNRSMASIDLESNQIGAAGATALAETLKTNRSVTTVSLDSNGISDAGATALAEALKVNGSVTSMNLQNNHISDAGAVALAEALKTNGSVTSVLFGANQIGDVLLKAIKEYVTRNVHDTEVRALQMKEEAARVAKENADKIGAEKQKETASIVQKKAEDSQAAINKIKVDIALYDKNIGADSKDANAHFMKAGALIKLQKLTKDNSYVGQALENYYQAIKLTNQENPLYLSERSKVYIEIGNTGAAIEDIKLVSKLTSTSSIAGIIDVGNTLRDVNKLETVQDTIKQLSGSGKISSEFTSALQEHVAVTASLVVQVGTHHGAQLDKSDSRIEQLELLIKQLQAGMNVSGEQITKLKQDTSDIKTQVSTNTAKIQEHEAALIYAAVYDKAKIKQDFEYLEQHSPERHAYCKTFYWTTLNLFGAYRALSTDVVSKNLDAGTTKKEGLAVKGAKKLAGYGADLVKGIPIIGSVMGLLDSVIDDIYDAVKENRLDNKINSINKIIESKFGLEEDISINIAKLSLSITETKKHDTLHSKVKGGNVLKTSVSWLQSKFDDIKGKILPAVELHEKDNEAVQLALKDVTVFMAYLCKNYAAIIKDNEPLDKQIVSIIEHGDLDKLIASATKKQATSSGSVHPAESSTNSALFTDAAVSKIETAIGKEDLAMIHKKASEGHWSKSILTMGKNVSEFLEESYLKELFGRSISAQDIENTLMVVFKHICIGIMGNEKLNPECAVKFSEVYPGIVARIAETHPELFIDAKIVVGCISDNALRNIVVSALIKQEQATTHMHAVTEIVYDNELLNHPDLFKNACKVLGYNKTLDLSKYLSAGLIEEALRAEDGGEMVLAGLISLECAQQG